MVTPNGELLMGVGNIQHTTAQPLQLADAFLLREVEVLGHYCAP